MYNNQHNYKTQENIHEWHTFKFDIDMYTYNIRLYVCTIYIIIMRRLY